MINKKTLQQNLTAKSFNLLLCILLLCSIVNGQLPKEELSFQSIKKEISQSSVRVVFEDSYGFLWIGTPDGIKKFNGSNFETFERSTDGKTGLSNEYVTRIYESNDKNLFIGTLAGLNIYNRKLNVVEPFAFKEANHILQSESINSIEKKDDNLFIGTYQNGLFKYNQKSGKTEQLKFNNSENSNINPNHILKSVTLDEQKQVVFTKSGIHIIDSSLNIIKQVNEERHLRCVLEIDKNNFVLGSNHGDIYFLEIDKNYNFIIHKKQISQGFAIIDLEKDNDGNIWVGTENDGTFIYSKSTDELLNIKANVNHNNSINGNSIWSLHNASNGVMWIGLFKQGLNYYDPNHFKFKHIKADSFESNSISNDIVNCFLEDEKGNIWIGTDGGGLNYWNRKQNTFEYYSLTNGNLNSDVVLSLLEDNKKQLWVGTWSHGIAIFEPNRKSYKVMTAKNSSLKSDYIRDLLQDKKGRIWIVTQNGGVQIYFPATGTFKDINLKSTHVDNEFSTSTIEEDNQGNMWVGTQTEGIFKIVEKIENTTWEATRFLKNGDHRTNKFISHDFVNTVTLDEEGIIWVGTQSGLNKYQSENDTFVSIMKKDGLINDAIKGIIKDDNNALWLSNGKGITRFNIVDKSSQNFDRLDGLQGIEFNANSFYKTKSGEFFFGGSNGFNIFDPKQIKKRQDKPKVHISALKIFNTPICPNDKSKILDKHISQVDSLILSYSDAVVDFEFNALNFRHPEKVEYAYFLEGFEKDWNYVGTRKSATYTNLNPGKYTLKIKSTNSDGVWNDNETSLHLTIVPPYWKTFWFKVLLIALTALAIYITYFIRIRNIKKYQVQLEQNIDERTKELLQQKNKLIEVADELSAKNEEIQRFAFAVSHDLKSPLSSIKGIASIIPMEFILKDFPEMENYLEMINISCDTMNDLIADITKIAKLGKIENKKKLLDTNEILNLAKTLVSGKLNVQNVQLIIPKNLPHIYGDRNRMIQVFGNLIDNAVKYMGDQKQPKIWIESKEEKDHVQFLIKDNGSGMDDNALKKLFSPFERFHENIKGTGLGLYMIKQIVESHDGIITALSEGLGKGSTFTVTMLKANQSAS